MFIALSFLLGLVPFVNLYRFNPIPSFWVQWSEFFLVVVFALYVLWLTRRRQDHRGEASVLSICLLGLSVILFAQIYAGVVGSRINALFAVMILLVGAVFHQAARLGLDSAARDRVLVWWASGVSVALVFQIIASLLQWYGKVWVPFRFIDIVAPPRIFGTFGQPNQFGVFIVLTLSALIYLARKKIIAWPIFVFGWVASAVLCAASGSRAALCIWLLLAAAHSAQEVRRNAKIDFPKLTYGWGLAWLHILFGSIQVMWGAGWIDFSSGREGNAASRVVTDVGPIVARMEQYRDSFALFVERPYFGYGFEQFAPSRFYYLSSSLLEPAATHTHNILTNALVELGIIGFIIVLIAVVWVVCGAFRALFSTGVRDEGRNMAAIWSLGLLAYSLLEYPFQYVNFFYTFLFVAAFIPGRGLNFDRQKAGVIRGARAIVMLCALLLSMLVAADYHRLQVMVLNMEAQIQKHGRVDNMPSMEHLTRLRQQSFFVRYVDTYWMKSLGVGRDVANLKVAVAKDLFEAVPAADSLSWYVVHLISAERDDEAVTLLCNFGRRNAQQFDLALIQVRSFANFYPPAQHFLKANHHQFSARCR